MGIISGSNKIIPEFTRIVKDWVADAHFQVIEWPVRSPHLNITENIWKMLEDIIYEKI